MARPTKVSEFSVEKVAAYFEYLDALRKSGVTNMFGAPPYLMNQFNLNRAAAVSVTSAWMNSFGDGTASVNDRASMARTSAERVA